MPDECVEGDGSFRRETTTGEDVGRRAKTVGGRIRLPLGPIWRTIAEAVRKGFGLDTEGLDNSVLALERLRAVTARCAAGERLQGERELAASLGVGRRAVRRALDVLEAEGLLWRRQGSGTYVGAQPPQTAAAADLARRSNPLEVLEARLNLEPALARLAALRASPQQVERMRALASRIAAADDADGRELWDGALHRAIAQASGNALLLAAFEMLDGVRRDPLWRAVREQARSRASAALYAGQHERIVGAVAARDPGGAEAAMREHLATLARNLFPYAGLEAAIAV